MPLSAIDADVRAWEQHVEEEGRLPAGCLREGRMRFLSSDRNWAVWTPSGGAVVCKEVDVAARLVKALGPRDGTDSGYLHAELPTELARYLPDVRCHLFITAFRPPSPVPVRAVPRAKVEKVSPNELPGDARLTGAEHVFAIRYGPSIVSDARSFPRLRVGDHWIYEVGVATHPGRRRRGYARAVLSALLQQLASEGATALWRSAAANMASVRLARSLGFIEHLWTLTWSLDEGVVGP